MLSAGGNGMLQELNLIIIFIFSKKEITVEVLNAYHLSLILRRPF